jgi:lipoprotein-releasing system permease protein
MIGLLKALGANDRLIRDVFIRLSIPIILKGMLIGNVIGIGLGILQDQFGFIKLSEASYYVSKVPVNISVTDLLLLNLGTFAVCFLMLLGPSLIIAKVSPSKTLRFD